MYLYIKFFLELYSEEMLAFYYCNLRDISQHVYSICLTLNVLYAFHYMDVPFLI